MADTRRDSFWKYARGPALPVIFVAVLVVILGLLLYLLVQAGQRADEANLREWLEESRVFRKTLPGLVREYLQTDDSQLRDEIGQQLQAMGNPTKMYQSQLPLFPTVYRLEVTFQTRDQPKPPIVWDSELPRDRQLVRTLNHPLLGEGDDRAVLRMEYQLHAYNRQQQEETKRRLLLFWGSVLGLVFLGIFVLWITRAFKREQRRALQQMLARQKIDQAEKLLLEKELHRQEAERNREEAERKVLQLRVATHEAEQKALELKSQLYAGIGIMAGSYAHNIKNLLVRPNDLLRRCLEDDGMSQDQEHMLQEVRGTLNTVTERLQEILKTVRRDPTRSEMTSLDLNEIVREMQRSWEEMAQQKWKLTLRVELWPEPLTIEGDRSHLMQAVENLLFNARDGTFEMRNHVREEARHNPLLSDDARRQALIAAASWRGSVTLRTRRDGDRAILEVADNGIGMTEEVRRRCVETHFSTKRDNALYEGNTTGMGLGLSFVQTILEHHHGRMEIISAPLQGATFQLAFPP